MTRKIVALVLVMLLLSVGTGMAFEFEPMAYQYLRSGKVTLSNAGSGTLYVYGETLAKQVVSTVEVTVILQQYKNGAWVDVWSERAVRNNASSVNIDKIVAVPKGYYYRVYGIHSVSHAGVTETNHTLSGSVYVN